MNISITKLISVICLVGSAIFLFDDSPAQADSTIIWQNVQTLITTDNRDLVPVREVLSKANVTVFWNENNGVAKLVLQDGAGKYEIPVNLQKNTLVIGKQDFAYSLQGNYLSASPAFFGTVLDHQGFSWDATHKALTARLNSDKASLIKSLIPYSPVMLVQEHKQETKVNQSVLKSQTTSAVSGTSQVGKPVYFESGQATWYGSALHGNLTASGERFNMNDLTAAHKTLPFGTRVKVTNQSNGLSVVVRITDRGPFAPGRIIDLSQAAAQQVNMISSGVAPVKLEILK